MLARHRRQSIRLGLAALVMGIASIGASAQVFPDVPRDHWAYDAAQWLGERRIVQGWDGKLHGNRSFTRYEMATLLKRFWDGYEEVQARVDDRLSRLEARLDRLERGEARLASHRPQARSPGGAVVVYPSVEATSSGVRRSASKPSKEGVRLLVPAGSKVRVHSFREGEKLRGVGNHALDEGSRVVVPKGAAAAVLFPSGTGYMVHGGGVAEVRAGKLETISGKVVRMRS